ncbi:MAG: DPP IV N-terminal domain-containing protein, partial [Cyclobacteriaceae bacterium]
MIKLKIAVIFLFFLLIVPALAQDGKKVTLEDVFKKEIFQQKSIQGINWMKDGQYYSTLIRENGAPKVVQVELSSGERQKTLIDGSKLAIDFSQYSFNADESKALLASEVESIYRRSTKGVYHVLDLATGELTPLMQGEKISFASLSPDNQNVAYVKDNDIYYTNISTGQVTQVTQDGEINKIINGAADWVYEEEFSMAKAFEWSPNGQQIAFIRFDEKAVREFNMPIWGSLYPKDYIFKYPKAGKKNAKVSLHVYHLNDNTTIRLDSGKEKDIYLPRFYWTGEASTLAFIRLNRLQNQMDLFHADAQTGANSLTLTENSDTYVDLNYNDNLVYLDNKDGFMSTSEKDGYKHIYHYDLQGNVIRQITDGEWEVTELIGVDQENKKVYYVSTETSPLERHFYVINFNGKQKKRLTSEPGTHQINMSPDFKFYIDSHSTASQPL